MTVWRHTQLSDEFLPSVVHHLALLWRNMRQLETIARYCHKNTDWCSFICPIFDQSLHFVPILHPIHMLQGCLFGLKKCHTIVHFLSIKKMSPKNLPTRAGEHHSPLSRAPSDAHPVSWFLDPWPPSATQSSWSWNVLQNESKWSAQKKVSGKIWQNQILRKGFG